MLPSQAGNVIADWYMQFRVADLFLFQGAPPARVRLEIEFDRTAV